MNKLTQDAFADTSHRGVLPNEGTSTRAWAARVGVACSIGQAAGDIWNYSRNPNADKSLRSIVAYNVKIMNPSRLDDVVGYIADRLPKHLHDTLHIAGDAVVRPAMQKIINEVSADEAWFRTQLANATGGGVPFKHRAAATQYSEAV